MAQRNEHSTDSKATSSDPVSPDPDDTPTDINDLSPALDTLDDSIGVGKKPTPGLYIVSTPIGHARDISLRALDVLRHADIVACEDTRVTSKLMNRYGLKVNLKPYHDHNARFARPYLIERLQQGQIVALVSDAGTPLISDPGYKLVCDCYDLDLKVTAIPGASSVMTALVLSGLPTDRFLFEGFMPNKTKARRTILSELTSVKGSLVFLESAKRLAASLTDMSEVLGERQAAVTRELTKLFEEVRRGSLAELAQHYIQAGAPKGEVTIVVGPPVITEVSEDDLKDIVAEALENASVRDAVKQVVEATGLAKKKVYALALALSKNDT